MMMKFWLANKSRKPAFYIAGIYMILGLLWIVISDRASHKSLENSSGQLFYQTLKGGLFVITTAILLFVLILKQIHSRNQLIHLLRANNNLLNQILDKNIGFDILIVNDVQEIIFARGESKIWSGRKTTELLGSKLKGNSIDGNESESFQNFYTRLWESQSEMQQEISVLEFKFNLHGSIITYKVEPESEADKDMVLLIFKNISEEKRLEVELRNSNELNNQNLRKNNQLTNQINEADERLKVLTDNLYNGIILCTTNHNGGLGKIIQINKTAKKLFKKNGLETDVAKLKEVLIFDEENEASLLFENDFRQKKQVVLTLKVPDDNNSQKPIEIIGRFLTTQSNTYIILIIRDIQKETITQTNSINLDIQSILNAFTLGVMLIKPHGQYLFINDFMKDHLTVDLSNNDETTNDLLSKIGGDIDINKYLKRCFDGEIVQIPHHHLGENQKSMFASTLYPIKDRKGIAEAALRVVADVSFIYDFDRKMQTQKHSNEESTKLRTVFLSNLSHEIRTPMNGIQGFVELLKNENLNEIQTKYLHYIQQSCDNLLEMLNALIEMSQLENKEISIKKTRVSLQEILNKIEIYIKDESEKLGKNSLKFKQNILVESLNMEIFTDEDKVIQIWKNLISNALKFTQQGIIEYGLTLHEDGRFEIWTADTGVGIKPYNINAIFLPFATFNVNDQVVFGGLGLGLSIAKAYTELLGGEIFIDSKEMEGSKFTVSLPLNIMNDTIKEKKTQNLLLEKILIVQHGTDGTKELIENLESFGVKTIHVQNGATAIEVLMEQEDIDLIICDTRLSDINGLELIKVIKRIRKQVPVIAQTFFFIQEERNKFLNSGFEDYLLKPINKSILYSWITQGK